MNKNKIILLIVSFCLNSCQTDLVKKPKDLIPQNKMESIIQDMILMKSISRNYQTLILEKKWFGDKYIYEKYKIDCLQLMENQKYYAKSPKIYLEMHKNIKSNMERLIDSIDVLSKEQAKKIKEQKLKKKESLNLK
ncbi:MAG: DUF4296 domain-containing protein [Flavobacteriaceae bacterium]|nr:DUF4296 domain-containing protein [Flavobacteriaceae bacterium]